MEAQPPKRDKRVEVVLEVDDEPPITTKHDNAAEAARYVCASVLTMPEAVSAAIDGHTFWRQEPLDTVSAVADQVLARARRASVTSWLEALEGMADEDWDEGRPEPPWPVQGIEVEADEPPIQEGIEVPEDYEEPGGPDEPDMGDGEMGVTLRDSGRFAHIERAAEDAALQDDTHPVHAVWEALDRASVDLDKRDLYNLLHDAGWWAESEPMLSQIDLTWKLDAMRETAASDGYLAALRDIEAWADGAT